MGKSLYIAEKPSVAKEFAKALGVWAVSRDGYMESEDCVITWCVGHLVTMSYPDAYDTALKKWSFSTLPFMPDTFKYEVIPAVQKQYNIVKGLLHRKDVATIYVCTDSGREGEYIYRLVDQMANVPKDKEKKRVWIDSQTEEEINRGIREAKPLEAYDALSDAAYLRAKEDYLMGINFSRVLSLKYGQTLMRYLNTGKWSAISVGRVMTCVLGMVVRREREIREFVKTPFYRVLGKFGMGENDFLAEWKCVEGSHYENSPLLYKENGFRKEETAKELIDRMKAESSEAVVEKVEKKNEKKNPPLLFNLAELQNVCAKMFKMSPDETLKIVQELYEKKLVTYPRTDARVLSTAVAKEIHRNIAGLRNYQPVRLYATKIFDEDLYRDIAKTRYVNDKRITDHYAIIPTGQGFGALKSISRTAEQIYEIIVRRFLCIFYPSAVYQKSSITIRKDKECFFCNSKICREQGFLEIATASFATKKVEEEDTKDGTEHFADTGLLKCIDSLKKGTILQVLGYSIKEGETTPPKRYNSGSMILAMENAGQLIEDEELRAQIKGSGIGTSATRAEILHKLVKISYLALNKKTQIIMPTQLGEMVYDVVNASIRSLLNPELTASWEKGLTYVANGEISKEEYMQKLTAFVSRGVNGVRNLNNQGILKKNFDAAAVYYNAKPQPNES